MKKKARILCLDGGGIRGIIPASVLKYIESKLVEYSDNQNARIADYFDMIVGGLDTVNYQVALLFDILDDENKKNYKRVDVPKKYREDKPLYNSDMSDASSSNINNLLKAGQYAIEDANKEKSNEHTLDKFIKKLIEIGPNSYKIKPRIN